MTCWLSHEMPITVMEQQVFWSYLHKLIFHRNFIGIKTYTLSPLSHKGIYLPY